MSRITPFTQGPVALVKKMNDIIDVVNLISNMTGDGLVQVARTHLGMTLKINPDRIAPYIPKVGSAGGAAIWAIVTQMPEYNDPAKAKFIVEKATIVTIGLNDIWEGDGVDIEIDKAIGYEGYELAGEDIRNWSPWPAVGAIVKIVAREIIATVTDPLPPRTTRQSVWMLDYPIMFGGNETDSSFRANPTTGASEAVFA